MSDRASEMPARSNARRDFAARGAIVLAPPSVLASWVFALLTEVCALLPAKLQARIIDREDPLPSDADVPQIYLSHYPSAPLLGVCAQGDGPILLCLDDPVDSVRFLRQTLGSGVVEALRAETAAAASYAALRTRPRLLILHRLAEASAAEIVELILDHLGLFLGGKEREALIQRWLPEGDPEAGLEAALRARIPGYAPLGESGLGPKDVAMIGGVLSPLLQMSFRETAGPIVWPIEAFLSGDKPNTPASLVAELTGGARILFYGPYFYLPAGPWNVRMMIGFSADARSMPFSVQVYAADRLVAVATLKAESHGVYHASFRFTHDTPLTPVELRFSSDRGAIEGRVALGNVEFTRESAEACREAAG